MLHYFKFPSIYILLLGLLIFSNSQFSKRQKPDIYTRTVTKIRDTVANDTNFKHQSYKRTAYLVDTFGPRLWGSQTLELALQWVRDELIKERFENVRLEEIPNVPRWVRGKESLTMLSPRPFPSPIPMVGLGKSVAGNVTSEVVMFKSFEELEENSSIVKDKIVFFNMNWTNYGETVKFRTSGPSVAAKHGAIGCIIRSIASSSLENPHTGALYYEPGVAKIPAAAVSIETADMFSRIIKRGQKLILNLHMEAHYEGTTTSHNVIGEFIGSQFPNEIILMGGHIDSWDVGPQTGANDDAAGFMVCLEAIRTLIKLGLRPKRTLRFIAWSGEEMGEINSGANIYAQTHANEMDNHIIAFESDSGTKKLNGWGFSGSDTSYVIVKKINELFLQNTINTTQVKFNDGEMVDTGPLYEKFNIPVMRNLIDDTPDEKYYFTYHHSAGDSMNILDADDMDSNVVGIASLFYVIADLPIKLPRK
jgi:carboxypeptidase Q